MQRVEQQIRILVQDIKEQRRTLLDNEVKDKPFITKSQRDNQCLPYDPSRVSFAFWYDPDEIKRIVLGIRGQRGFCHY